MNNILVVIVWMFKNVWPVPVFIFVVGAATYYLLGYYHKSVGVSESVVRDRIGQITLLATVFAIPFTFALQSSISVPIINMYGALAKAEVLSSFRMSSLYNQEPIMAYRVRYPLEDGEPFESSFKASDFNVYPQSNMVTYPKVGSQFSLKYLKSYPHYFIIMSEENIEG